MQDRDGLAKTFVEMFVAQNKYHLRWGPISATAKLLQAIRSKCRHIQSGRGDQDDGRFEGAALRHHHRQGLFPREDPRWFVRSRPVRQGALGDEELGGLLRHCRRRRRRESDELRRTCSAASSAPTADIAMPSWPALLSQAFNGLALGALLALVSSGLTIILGTLGVLNFAHGALFAVGAYLSSSSCNTRIIRIGPGHRLMLHAAAGISARENQYPVVLQPAA